MQVDKIFKKYHTERNEIAQRMLISDNIFLDISKSITIDNDCRRAMGNGEYKSPYSCEKCSEISEITSMRNGEIKSFEIEAGSKNGDNMIVLKDENPLSKIEIDHKALQRYNQLTKLVGLCNPPKTNVELFIAIGTWMNGIIMSYLIESILTKNNIPHCLPIEVGFQCKRVGYSIRSELPCLISFNPNTITSDGCRSILQQIAITLHALSEYSFIHGSATIDRIHVDTSVDCNYKYNKYNIIGDFIIKIAEYHFSSITVNKTRLFPHPLGRNVNIISALNDFAPIVERKNSLSYDIEDDSVTNTGDTIFKVTCDAPSLFTTMRYSGYPLFGGAYDMYSFFISLMSWKPFSDCVRRDIRLSNIWTGMFPNKDQVPKISTDSVITCSYRISEHLKDKWLYCNVVEKLLDQLEIMIDFDIEQ